MSESKSPSAPPPFGDNGSPGQPLPPPVQHQLEGSLGGDFSSVRVHESNAVLHNQATKSTTDQAFTSGSDIYFAPGTYQPNSESGQKLLSHELAHVVQQRDGGGAGPK